MANPLENLCGPGKPLKAEAPDANEIAGLLRTGIARLHDARNAALALESRFDLAYNAAHALSLAALRRMGYLADSDGFDARTLRELQGVVISNKALFERTWNDHFA